MTFGTPFNFHTSTFSPYPKYTSDKAHDGDYDTWYSVEDGAVAGNFLKLYLGGSYKIGKVKVTSRGGKVFLRRLENTEVRVYMSSGDDETSVASCGEIHGTEILLDKKYSDYILHLMRNLFSDCRLLHNNQICDDNNKLIIYQLFQ